MLPHSDLLIPGDINDILEFFNIPISRNPEGLYYLHKLYLGNLYSFIEKHCPLIKKGNYNDEIECDEEEHIAQGYLFTEEMYPQVMMLIKEGLGHACEKERWHQIQYLTRHEKWEELLQCLSLLSAYRQSAWPKFDYNPLFIKLYKHLQKNHLTTDPKVLLLIGTELKRIAQSPETKEEIKNQACVVLAKRTRRYFLRSAGPESAPAIAGCPQAGVALTF